MGRWKAAVLAALAFGTAIAQPPAQFTRLELEWSRSALPAIERQPAVSAVDPEALLYVTELGNRLAGLAPLGWPLRYRFIVYDDQVGLDVPYFGRLGRLPGVATLPGGVVLVPLSLFRVSADESEFAAGLARGIAHVFLRHVLRAASIGAYRPGTFGKRPFMKSWIFTRNMEREADYAAAGLLARAGFDPAGLARAARNSLASFDASPRRSEWVEKAVGMQPQRRYARGSSPQFLILKMRLGGPLVAL